MNGTVFDIKEFAIYDGPGVRQTVFFKGCPLRCAWCHNPEGLKAVRELGVSAASCLHCGNCREVCGAGAWNDDYMRADRCALCESCIQVCPAGIRRVYGRIYTPDELAEKILGKADYYAKLGGGVTFSGGEPLMQADFLTETLRLLPGVHKAIETCAYADSEIFAEVAELVDYVIMDVKCMSDELHRKYTGVSNEKIIGNYRQLRRMEKPHTVRIPLIGCVSSTAENLEATARLLAGDTSLERVELLPYQPTAGAKYRQVGRVYENSFEVGGDPADAAKIFEQYGLRCRVL